MKRIVRTTLSVAIALATNPLLAQTANTKTTVTYDALDRVTQVTDPSGLNTTYQYDGLGDPVAQTSPDTGVTARTYDAAGNVLTGTDAKGNTVTYTYDVLDRRISASYADSSQNITYKYDELNSATGCSVSYPVGRLTRVIENAVTTTFCYNAQGYVIQKSQTVNGQTDVTSYTRSPAGRIQAITHPSGDKVNYTYDAAGRVSGVSVTTNSSTTNVVSNITYEPFGPVNGYTLGNGQTITRTYDANYRLTDLTSPAFALHVARDAMGNITAIGDSPGATPATESYSYDPLYRLTSVTEANGSVLQSVTYNQTGDRLTKTGSGLSTGAYSYNPNTHQLVATGNSARTVDANGNTTAISQAGTTYGFGYNQRNRLCVVQQSQSTIATYIYNAHGERVSKTSNGSTERYNYGPGYQLLSEYGATNREYVYFDGIPVANMDTQGGTTSITYVTADQSGTPRAVVDGSGSILWAWPYQGNPWGELQPVTNGYAYNLRFPGQYFDVETGMTNNILRDYDSSGGRFLQSDPIGLNGAISTYAAQNNNPLKYIDPTGMDAILMVNPSSVNFLHADVAFGGHAAVAVGNDNTGWNFYSEGGYDDNGKQIITTMQFPNLDALENALASQYPIQEGEHTQPLQDIFMNTWAKEHLKDPFHATTNNCADFAMNVLRAGGLHPTANRIGPTIPNDTSISDGSNDPDRFDPLAGRRGPYPPGFAYPPSPTNSSPWTLGNPHTY